MKKLLLLTVGLAALSVSAFATPGACFPPGVTDVLTLNAAGGCIYGPLLFSNFAYTPGASPGAGPVNIIGTQYTPAFGDYQLQLNPNIGSGGAASNLVLTFLVSTTNGSKGILSDAFSNGGDNGGVTSIQQIICTGAIDGSGNCSGTILDNRTLAINGNAPDLTFAPQSSVGVYMKFHADAGHVITGAGTDFNTPEPMSMALFGSGLVGLALIRRNRKIRS